MMSCKSGCWPRNFDGNLIGCFCTMNYKVLSWVRVFCCQFWPLYLIVFGSFDVYKHFSLSWHIIELQFVYCSKEKYFQFDAFNINGKYESSCLWIMISIIINDFIFRSTWVTNLTRCSLGYRHFVNIVLVLFGSWRKGVCVKVSINNV